MIDGNLALQLNPETTPTITGIQELPDIEWTFEQHTAIVNTLVKHGCTYLKGRDEYTLLKEEVVSRNFTQETNLRKNDTPGNPVISTAEGSGVISPLCRTIGVNDTTPASYKKPFLAPLDVQKAGSIADIIPSFKVIQSNSMSLNIGFDTEFQDFRKGFIKNRRVLSLQMTIAIGESFIRYFFLVDPRYQEVTAEDGKIPLKYCLADILADLKKCFFSGLSACSE